MAYAIYPRIRSVMLKVCVTKSFQNSNKLEGVKQNITIHMYFQGINDDASFFFGYTKEA
jgi:hypothetical protein